MKLLNTPYTHLYEQWPSLSVCCEVTQNSSQDFSLVKKTKKKKTHMLLIFRFLYINIIYCHTGRYLLTSYLYCSNSSLWVMTNWAFLFLNTRFPIIRPKASGLNKEATDLYHNLVTRLKAASYSAGEQLAIKIFVTDVYTLTEAVTALPADGLYQPGEHSLHPPLGNVFQQLPANPLPHHVWMCADRQTRSHHCQQQICRKDKHTRGRT